MGDLAAQSGLDREDFLQALEDGIYGPEEKKAVTYSRQELKVEVIPTIYINGKQISLETYTKEEMTGILRQFAKKEAE